MLIELKAKLPGLKSKGQEKIEALKDSKNRCKSMSMQ